MKSQSFDDWLSAEEPLDPEMESALAEAIASIAPGDDQLPLVHAYHEVETLFKAAPPMAPASGFTSRWQVRLARKKARQQTLAIGLSSLLALLVAAVIGADMLLPLAEPFSLTAFANNVFSGLVHLTIELYNLRGLTGYLLGQVPPAIPIALWIGLATSLSLVALAWVFALWRIIIPKGLKS